MTRLNRTSILGTIGTMILALGLFAACGGADVDEGVIPDAGPTPDASGIDANNICAPGTPPDMCNFFTGCGCDVAGGSKCTVVDDSRTCGPAGEQERDTACTQDGMCELGTLCATYADAQRCMQFCDAQHPCGANSACFVRVTGPADMTEGRVCGQICGLLSQDCAGKAQGCYPSAATLGALMERGICVDAGTAVEGAACEAANDCAEGLTCIDSGTCVEMCDRNGANTCTAGLTCKALVGHTTTGVCQP
jgi:hypothetical protein